LLADVPGELGRISSHLQLPVDAHWLAQAGSSPVLARYSKSPDHEYSPSLRSQILGDARREHRAEIDKGLRWLDALARKDGNVATVLAAAST
jgi:hypothetical protein